VLHGTPFPAGDQLQEKNRLAVVVREGIHFDVKVLQPKSLHDHIVEKLRAGLGNQI